jgi:hypothetical protein
MGFGRRKLGELPGRTYLNGNQITAISYVSDKAGGISGIQWSGRADIDIDLRNRRGTV